MLKSDRREPSRESPADGPGLMNWRSNSGGDRGER
jgi:hypothetical protein